MAARRAKSLADPVKQEHARAWRRAWTRRAAEKDPGYYTKAAGSWKAKNPERVRFMNSPKNWSPERRARHALNHRLWMLNNKDRSSRAHLPGAGVTGEQWTEIVELHGHRCAYCLVRDAKLTVDHVVPLSRGGWHAPDNVVPACRSCNSRKRDRPVWAMLSSLTPPS